MPLESSTSAAPAPALVPHRLLHGAPDDRPRERRYRGGRLEVGLHVHLAQLDRAEPWLWPGVPPDHRVVRGPAAGANGVKAAQVLVPIGQERRDPATRVRPDHRRPRAGHPGVASEPERGVRAEPVQQRQPLAQAVHGGHRRVRIGQADVHVERALRRALDEALHLPLDALVALRLDELHVEQLRVRMKAGGDGSPRPARGRRPALGELGHAPRRREPTGLERISISARNAS